MFIKQYLLSSTIKAERLTKAGRPYFILKFAATVTKGVFLSYQQNSYNCNYKNSVKIPRSASWSGSSPNL